MIDIIIIAMLIVVLVMLVIIANMVDGMRDTIDSIKGDTKYIYYKVQDIKHDVDDMLTETTVTGETTAALAKRFGRMTEAQKKKEQDELEKKNDHVKRVVERVKSVLYPYAPNMWQYVYEERKDRNRHKFTIMCKRDEDIMSAVREAFYYSDIEWSERHDQWEREWIVYIYDAE